MNMTETFRALEALGCKDAAKHRRIEKQRAEFRLLLAQTEPKKRITNPAGFAKLNSEIKKQIILRRTRNESAIAIAASLNISVNSVYSVWATYQRAKADYASKALSKKGEAA